MIQPGTSRTNPEISSAKMVTVLTTEADMLFSIVLSLLALPDPEWEDSLDMGRTVIQALAMIVVHFTLMAISLVPAVLQFKHQIFLLMSVREPRNLSALALGMDVPELLLLAVMQATRLSVLEPNTSYPLWGWLSNTENMSVNYVVTAVGNMILLGLCLRLLKLSSNSIISE